MADSSCIAFHGHGENGENVEADGDKDNNNISPSRNRWPSSRRTHSFSCSSSSFRSSPSSFGSSSFFDDSSPSSPITPLPFSGIPFSWEQHPGIPKKYFNPPPFSKTKDEEQEGSSLALLLPLPPPINPIPSKRFNLESILSTTRKKNSQHKIHADPFVAAFMECSKDLQEGDDVDDCGYWKGNIHKASRTLSDRLVGFVDLHTSCKNSCAVSVSNSTVFIPKSSRAKRYHHLLNHHHHQKA